MLHAAAELNDTAPRVAYLAQKMMRQLQYVFIEVLARGQREEKIRSDQSAEFLATHLMGLLTSVKAWQRMGMGEEQLTDYVENVLLLIRT
jgi:hypothetical protein